MRFERSVMVVPTPDPTRSLHVVAIGRQIHVGSAGGVLHPGAGRMQFFRVCVGSGVGMAASMCFFTIAQRFEGNCEQKARDGPVRRI
jgi:hypothetical protein